MKNQVFTFLVSLLGYSSFAQRAIFEQKIILPLGQSKAETALAIAQSFVGQPYESHTLEESPERLICNLTNFDCYTFVESVLALTEARYGSKKYSDYQQIVQKLRYRNGQIDGYASRLHYFSEWIAQAQKNNFVRDITTKISDNEPFSPTIDFMTKHRKLYAQLSDDAVFEAIGESERRLSKSKKYYLPKNKIDDSFINDGDIIGITSNTSGLDFNHEGFAIKQHGQVYLLHASSDLKQVVVSKEPLIVYLQKVKKHSGIVVLRLVP